MGKTTREVVDGMNEEARRQMEASEVVLLKEGEDVVVELEENDLANVGLSTAKAEGGVEVEIVKPGTGLPFLPPMKVAILGADSKKYRRLMGDVINQTLSRNMKGRPPAANEDQNVNLVAGITVEWNLVENGKPVVLSFEKAVEVYKRFPWMKEQLERASRDRTLFFGN